MFCRHDNGMYSSMRYLNAKMTSSHYAYKVRPVIFVYMLAVASQTFRVAQCGNSWCYPHGPPSFSKIHIFFIDSHPQWPPSCTKMQKLYRHSCTVNHGFTPMDLLPAQQFGFIRCGPSPVTQPTPSRFVRKLLLCEYTATCVVMSTVYFTDVLYAACILLVWTLGKLRTFYFISLAIIIIEAGAPGGLKRSSLPISVTSRLSALVSSLGQSVYVRKLGISFL